MASFWLRQMDTVANVYDTITSISSFPLVVLSKKIMYCLTYILPIGFMATKPVTTLAGGVIWKDMLFIVLFYLFSVILIRLTWRRGKYVYESSN